LAAGFRPDPLEKLKRFLDPLAAIKGVLLLRGGGKGKGREGKEGKGKEGKERERRKKEENGKRRGQEGREKRG